MRELHGLGTTFEVDPELVVPDPDQTINEGAIAPWRSAHTQYFTRMLEAVADAYEIDLDAPYRTLSAKQQKIVMHGVTGNLQVKYKNRYGRQRQYNTSYEGVIPWISAATRVPRATGRASSTRATCGWCRARRVTAPG
ncbi:MAG: hypothetical protein R2713_11705 [Ilumatobacteraceae bacterium]